MSETTRRLTVVGACAAALMLTLAWPLWRRLPALVPTPAATSYPRLIASMFTLLREERVLQIRGMLALLMFATFSIFWSALVLPLRAPPYAFSHTVIGAFGLVGVAAGLTAAPSASARTEANGPVMTASPSLRPDSTSKYFSPAMPVLIGMNTALLS